MERKSILIARIFGLYSNTEEIVTLVEKHDLKELLAKVIKNFDDCFLKHEIDRLPVLACVSLTQINDRVLKILPEEEKKKIQYFISDLFEEYQLKINNLEIAPDIYYKIIEALKIACDVANYSYVELEKILRLDKIALQARYKSKPSVPQCYYKWNRKPHELDEIAKDLKDREVITSTKEFKKLFKEKEEPHFVHCNSGKEEDILILFSIFHEKKLVTVVGSTGKFVPLINSIVDKNNLFLFKKMINKKHELLKRKKEEYNKMKGFYEQLIFKNIS